MSFDNVIFNVNGESKEDFISAVKLALSIRGRNPTTVAFRYVKGRGLVFFWSVPKEKDTIELMQEMNPEQAAEYAWAWLQKSPDAEKEIKALSEIDEDDDSEESIANSYWDRDSDHDGHNSVGWRVFVEDWGHVNGQWSAWLCVKPVFVWHGK